MVGKWPRLSLTYRWIIVFLYSISLAQNIEQVTQGENLIVQEYIEKVCVCV